jgi:hypothetical protein
MSSTARNSGGRRHPRAATAAERAMNLPGEDLVPAPMLRTTRAITINAPPQRVWPWLVQLGHGRAGFYSDSRLWDRCVDWYYRRLSKQRKESAPVGYRVEASDRVVAAWQNPGVGDIIADGPPGTAHYVVREVDPFRIFVLTSDTHLTYLVPARLRTNPRLGLYGQLSAGYLLTEPVPGTTRLIRRMRMRCGPWAFRAYVEPIVVLWGEVLTARRFLLGIKRRAEAAERSAS